MEVIVVDNGSFDGCREMLAREFPSVGYVQSATNIGLGAANNLGVKRATGDHLMFLHPDTEFIENTVGALMRWLKILGNAGAVGCQLLNPDRTVQTDSVRSFPTIANQMLDSEYLRERFPDSPLWGQRALHAKWPRHAEVEVVSSTCILMRRSSFERVGGFDEQYFVFGANVDLCFKLKQRGELVYYVPETSLVHFGGRDAEQLLSRGSNLVIRESVYRFLRLNIGRSTALGYRCAMGLSALVRLVLIPPMMPLGKVFVRHGRCSWTKWFTVLRWSVGQIRAQGLAVSGRS